MQLQWKNSARRRGAVLTAQGLRKLNQAKSEAEIEQNFRRYTLEALSKKTGLTPNTLSKIFIGSVGVDFQTLQCCFKAFNLTLQTEDYLYLKPKLDNLAKMGNLFPVETCSSLDRTDLTPLTPLPCKGRGVRIKASLLAGERNGRGVPRISCISRYN